MSQYIHSLYKMDYYADRGGTGTKIADQCVDGVLCLHDTHFLDTNGYKGNIFEYQFHGNDVILKNEYLFTMDYLSYVLTAYQETGNEIYKRTFEKFIGQFHEFLQTNEPVYDALPIFGQTLLFIKAIALFGDLPYQDDFMELLLKYAHWLMDDANHVGDHNHGLFQDFALLHISVLLSQEKEAAFWQEYAVRRINNLFQIAYFNDHTNNENSIAYFDFNNDLYEKIIQFCRHYHIAGMEGMEERLQEAKDAFHTFAHKDFTFPVIGDGRVFKGKTYNDDSRVFPDIGIAIIKTGDTYLSFKCKTAYQSHAHTDISSITVRYKNIDLMIDSGQYNYDRYTPANRFMRSTAGHSGIFPVFADGMFQKEFCEETVYSEISAYERCGSDTLVRGEYQLRDVRVCREITVKPAELIVKDSWHCEKPTAMRQRFILPKELIENSRFTASRHLLESKKDNVKFKFEIQSDREGALTTVSFGIAAPQYDTYEVTMLLDTFVENTVSGEIIAKICMMEE